jgi:hypothetical protein
LPSRHKSINFGLRLLLRRTNRKMGSPTLIILRKTPVKPNLKERRSGPGRRSFLRKESQSPRLLMAPPTISNVNTTPSSGYAIPLKSAARTPRTMAFHANLVTLPRMPRSNSRLLTLLLLPLLLSRETTCRMATLMDTEEEAGKDCRLHSSLLSIGHSFSSCMLLPHGSYPLCAWSYRKRWCTSKLWYGFSLNFY